MIGTFNQVLVNAGVTPISSPARVQAQPKNEQPAPTDRDQPENCDQPELQASNQPQQPELPKPRVSDQQ